MRSNVKRTVLRRGSLFAVCGILLWVVTGALLPLPTLTTWGPGIFIIGGIFIAFGMVPYRRLTHLEDRPHRILIDANVLHFFHKGKELFSMPLTRIEKVEYFDDAVLYGIAVWLHPGDPTVHLTGHRKNVVIRRYVAKVRRRYGCDLFFPYFSKSAYHALASSLDEVMQGKGTNVGDSASSRLPISS